MSAPRFGGEAAKWVGAALVTGKIGLAAPVVLPVLAGGVVAVGLVAAAKHFIDKSKEEKKS
jgi:hypothetical protein